MRYVIRDNSTYFVKFHDINSTNWTLDKKEATRFTDKAEIDDVVKELEKRGYSPVINRIDLCPSSL